MGEPSPLNEGCNPPIQPSQGPGNCPGEIAAACWNKYWSEVLAGAGRQPGGGGGMPIRLLIVDDHEVVRQGLRVFLSGDPTLEIVGEAADGSEAVELARQLHPD